MGPQVCADMEFENIGRLLDRKCASLVNTLCPAVAVISFYALVDTPLLGELDEEWLRAAFVVAIFGGLRVLEVCGEEWRADFVEWRLSKMSTRS